MMFSMPLHVLYVQPDNPDSPVKKHTLHPKSCVTLETMLKFPPQIFPLETLPVGSGPPEAALPAVPV